MHRNQGVRDIIEGAVVARMSSDYQILSHNLLLSKPNFYTKGTKNLNWTCILRYYGISSLSAVDDFLTLTEVFILKTVNFIRNGLALL